MRAGLAARAAVLTTHAVVATLAPGPARAADVLALSRDAVVWSELDVHDVGLDLGTVAQREAARDSIRAHVSTGLADWVEAGAPRWDEVPLSSAEWIQERVREGLLLADPRWGRFLAALTASRERAAPLLRHLDPQGDWTLPGALFLLSRAEPAGATRLLGLGRWPADDAPFLAILAAEARRAGGDPAGAGRTADSLLAAGSWPSWTREPLVEAQIEAHLAAGRLDAAGGRLEEYGREFKPGPWYLGTKETLFRKAGRSREADSLAWALAASYPGQARAKQWLETQVPLDAKAPGGPRVLPHRLAELNILLRVAEEARGFDRFLLLAEAVRAELARTAGAPAARYEKERLDLRAADVGYAARRYQDLRAAVADGRIVPGTSARWGIVLGRTYRNTGTPDSMAVWYDRAVRSGSPAERNDALWEWAKELSALRRFEEAESVYARMALLGAGDKAEDVDLRIGFVRFQQRRYAEAEAAFAAVSASTTAWRAATADFWTYRCRLARGDGAGARIALERAARRSDGYYAARARSALRWERGEDGGGGGAGGASGVGGGTSGVGGTSDAVPIDDIEGYWRRFAEEAARPALTEIGFRADMGAEVIRAVASPSLAREAERLWLFRQYDRSTWAARALEALDADPALGDGEARIAMLHELGFPDLAARRVVRNGQGGVANRYPAPYGAAVAAAAARGGLAPEWMWAVMRRESFFEATVRSHVGATGLMQFMPETAAKVGKEHGLSAAPLTSPVVNLALGIAHLRELVDETKGDWPLLLAGYNAGMHNAVRWVHEDDDPDVYMEMIDFRETRDYVKAVLEGFWIYRETLRSGRVRSAGEGAGGGSGRAPGTHRAPTSGLGSRWDADAPGTHRAPTDGLGSWRDAPPSGIGSAR